MGDLRHGACPPPPQTSCALLHTSHGGTPTGQLGHTSHMTWCVCMCVCGGPSHRSREHLGQGCTRRTGESSRTMAASGGGGNAAGGARARSISMDTNTPVFSASRTSVAPPTCTPPKNTWGTVRAPAHHDGHTGSGGHVGSGWGNKKRTGEWGGGRACVGVRRHAWPALGNAKLMLDLAAFVCMPMLAPPPHTPSVGAAPIRSPPNPFTHLRTAFGTGRPAGRPVPRPPTGC